MKIGVYKISLKAKPTKFYIIGTANIESYWSENGDKNLKYELIWECNKLELQRYTSHFIERLKPNWDEEVQKVGEIEQAKMDEPETEKAIIEPKVRKKPVKSKSKK